MANFLPKWLIVAFFILSALGSAKALVFGTYVPARHDRFASGFPGTSTTASTSGTFLMDDYDLSGIGWSLADSRRTATMISPRHFVTARHFGFGVGGSVRFLGSDGVTRDYVVTSVESAVNNSNEPTDLIIGTLDRDVHSSITFYPIADFNDESDYYGMSLLLQGLNSRWGTGTIQQNLISSTDPFLTFAVGSTINATRGYQFKVDATDASTRQDDVYFQGGDSSDPTFIVSNDKLVLIGVHAAAGGEPALRRSFDTFVPHYLDQIDAFIAPEGYAATRVDNAPPSTLTLACTDSVDPAPGGTAFTYEFTATNSSSRVSGISVEITLPSEGTYSGFTGDGWTASQSTGTVTLTRSSIARNSASSFQIFFTPQAETTFELLLSATISGTGMLDSDTASETTQVFKSFSEFVSGLADTTEAGDPDNDGIPNLTEYFLGLDAGAYSSEPDLAPATDGTLTYTRRRRAGASGVFMVSDNLTSWAPLTGTEATTPIDYNFETVAFTPTAPFDSGERRFLRFEVTD